MSEQQVTIRLPLPVEVWRAWRVSHVELDATGVDVAGALIRHWLRLDVEERRKILAAGAD